MVKISYKEPFLEMMDNLRDQMDRSDKIWNVTAITSMFTEIAEDVETDAENCDTTTNELATIASDARNAAGAAAFFGSGLMSETQRNFMVSYTRGIIEKFTSLDDSNIKCEVEESSPLSTYRRKLSR